MHRWYPEDLATLYLFVSERLSWKKLLLASAPRVWKGIKRRRHTFLVPGGRDHPWRSWACWEPWGERAPLWCLEGRPHPAAALQATRCLARAGHRWRTVYVSIRFHRRDSWICQVQGKYMFREKTLEWHVCLETYATCYYACRLKK